MGSYYRRGRYGMGLNGSFIGIWSGVAVCVLKRELEFASSLARSGVAAGTIAVYICIYLGEEQATLASTQIEFCVENRECFLS